MPAIPTYFRPSPITPAAIACLSQTDAEALASALGLPQPPNPLAAFFAARAAGITPALLEAALVHHPEASASLLAVLARCPPPPPQLMTVMLPSGRTWTLCPPRTHALDPITNRPRNAAPPRPRPPARRDPRVVTYVAPNPKKPGTATHDRYERGYRIGRTLDQCVEAGVTRGDIRWDLDRGFIRTVCAPEKVG